MKTDINITLIDRIGKTHQLIAPIDMGLNLMEVIKLYELPIKATCGGMALCATCQIYVESAHNLALKTEDEEAMLDEAYFVEANSRLSCQIQVNAQSDGLKIRIAPECF